MDDCIPLVADQYALEALPSGWVNAKVSLRHHNGDEETRFEIIDLRTNTRYPHEPLRMLAFKCFFLALLIPIYTIGYMGWNGVRALTTTLFSLIDETLWAGLDTAVRGIWTVVRAPFYGIQMFFGALIGIVFPLQGRKILGVEIQWHQKSIHEDLFRRPPNENPTDFEVICASFKQREVPYTVFLALCMQPLGKTTDPHIISIERLPQI